MSIRPVIVRSCNWVGEVILSVPAIRLLGEHGFAPLLVGKPWMAALLAGQTWPVSVRPGRILDSVIQLKDLRQQALLADPGFNRRLNALLMTNSISSALEMRLAGLRALGYRRDGRSLLLSKAEYRPAEAHALLRYWQLACSFLEINQTPPAAIGWLVSDADQVVADALIERHSLGKLFVLICPFAATQVNGQEKTWPHFPEFARALCEAGHRVATCPGPGEQAQLQQHFPAVESLTNVGLGVYAGLMRRAAMVVSNDTGPGHLAAAVGAPLVSVLGPTDPALWAPWGPQVQVLRKWPRWPTVNEAMVAVQVQPHAPATLKSKKYER